MKLIGLTGGIASGKSTASKILKELGAYIIDADKIAREVVELGSETLNKITIQFGEGVLNRDGTLNRKALGAIVFSDPKKLEKLNNITHSEIKKHINSEIEFIKRYENYQAVIIDAAMLIETGLNQEVDEVWLMFVDRNTQLLRLMERDNMSHLEAMARIDSQMSVEEKLKYSHKVIYNTKDESFMKEQIKVLWYDMLKV